MSYVIEILFKSGLERSFNFGEDADSPKKIMRMYHGGKEKFAVINNNIVVRLEDVSMIILNEATELG